MDLSFGLSRFGPEYFIMGLEASVIVFLFKRLMDAKDEQLKAAQEENERSVEMNEKLDRTSSNIFTFIKSYSNKANNK